MYSEAHQVGAHGDRLLESCSIPFIIHRLLFLVETKDNLLFIKRSIMYKTNKWFLQPWLFSPVCQSLGITFLFTPEWRYKKKTEGKSIYFLSCERMIQLYIVWGFPGKDTTLWCRNLSFYVEYTILTMVYEGRPAPSMKKTFTHSGRAEQIGTREGSRRTGTAGCWVLFSITGVSHQRAKVSSLKSLPCLPRPERRISFLDVTTDSTCPVCCPCQLRLPRCQSPVLLHAWILARLLLPLFNNFHGPCSLPVSPHWGMLGSLHRGLRWGRLD